MKLLLLLILFIGSVKAELPENLVDTQNINSIIFREIKTYMFQLTQASKIYEVSPECRLYKFASLSGLVHRNLKFCLITRISENRITQLLQVTVGNSFAGSFKFSQEGAEVHPLSVEEFINFKHPLMKKGHKSEFYFDHFTFGLIIDRRDDPEIIDSFFQLKDYRLNIFEDQAGEVRFRRYTLGCEDCDGVPYLTVQSDLDNTRYFVSTNPTEVTPTFFNQMLSNLITNPLAGVGIGIKNKLISDLNWPDL